MTVWLAAHFHATAVDAGSQTARPPPGAPPPGAVSDFNTRDVPQHFQAQLGTQIPPETEHTTTAPSQPRTRRPAGEENIEKVTKEGTEEKRHEECGEEPTRRRWVRRSSPPTLGRPTSAGGCSPRGRLPGSQTARCPPGVPLAGTAVFRSRARLPSPWKHPRRAPRGTALRTRSCGLCFSPTRSLPSARSRNRSPGGHSPSTSSRHFPPRRGWCHQNQDHLPGLDSPRQA